MVAENLHQGEVVEEPSVEERAEESADAVVLEPGRLPPSDDEVFAFPSELDHGARSDFNPEVEMSNASEISWKQLDNADETKATIGVAVDTAWEHAQAEFDHIQRKLEIETGTRRPNLHVIIGIVFGEDSTAFQAFKAEKLFNNHKEFLQFLATFFMCCSYQMSTKQLFDSDSRIDLEGAMGKDDYVQIWKKIGSASTPSPEERNKQVAPTGLLPFWMKLEEAFNTFTRRFFIEGFEGTMQVTVDDDKAHFNGTGYTAGLKTVRHTKDNRNGHTCHTMVNSFSQVPIQIAWERQVNDSAEEATKRCFANGITPMAAPGTPGDLRHVRTAKDRGYWSKDLIHSYIMPSGCKITAGTAKRQPCIPFTYQQKMHPNDKRIELSVNGPKTLYTAVATSQGRKIYSFAYRNGTGGITLGLSTEYGSKPEWELVVANPGDMKWYDAPTELTFEEKIKKCFHPLRELDEQGGLSDDFVEQIKSLGVKPLTTTQGTPEWFLLRRFALTSSTTDRAIASCKGDEDWLDNKDAWKTIKDVLAGVGAVETTTEDEVEDEVELHLPPNAQANGNVTEEAPTAETTTPTALTLDGLLSDDAVVELAKNQLAADEIDISVVRSILQKLGHTLSKAASATRRDVTDLKSFEDWLDAAPKLKQHYFSKKLAELVKLAESLNLDVSTCTNKREKVRKAINDHLLANPDVVMPNEPAPSAKASKRKATAEAFASLSEEQHLLQSVLRAGYLDPLQGKAKKYTRRGHQLERHIMATCIREHQRDDITTPLRVEKACTAPLVERDGASYARDSIDFVASVNGGDKSIGVEVKARVGNIRDQTEAQHVNEIRRLFGADSTPRQRKVKYFQVDAGDAVFAQLVKDTHEVVQVLHHAYVYSFDQVLLLVGDNNGEVMYGIFVNVSAELRLAYGKVLNGIYTKTLEWIYSDTVEDKPSDEDLEAVFKLIEVHGGAIDKHCFLMDLTLWKYVNRNMTFPLPRLARIIPLIFSLWNALKGGSDATTNLLWHCHYNIPTFESQAVAVARMLNLFAVLVHRLNQLCTGREDISKYDNLKRYRDAASSRRSFKKSLNQMVSEMVKTTANTMSTERTPQRQTAAAGRTSTRSQAYVQRVELPILSTHLTPQRNVQAKLKQLEEKKAAQGTLDGQENVLLERSKQCSGVAVHRIGTDGKKNGAGSRGRCAHCGSHTHSFCILCKRWLCSKMSDNFKKMDDCKRVFIINAESDNPIHVEPNCFYIHHRGVQEALVTKFSVANMSKM